MTFGIESSNIVGYMNDTKTAGKFYITAFQFNDVASGEIDVNKIASGLVGVDYDEDFAFGVTAPQIQVQKAEGGYDLYYYLNDGYVDDDTYVEGWCDGMGTIVDLKLTPGTAVWFKSPSEDLSLTVAGSVESDDIVSFVVPEQKFTLVGSAYPVAVTFNTGAMTSTDIKGVDYDEDFNFWTTAPQIQVQKPEGGYNLYYYLNDGYVDDDTYVEGWCDGMGTIVNDQIPAGAGFWVKSADSMTLQFSL